jgi:sec-independent protein translocase protein TatC
MFFLTKLGVVTPRFLARNQRGAIVVILIVAAVLSPPDVFSQVLMAVPLLVLFELSILASFLAAPRARPAA